MKKSTFKKFVALALVVMMLAATCIVNVASASNLTISFVPSIDNGAEIRANSAAGSVLTDGVKEGGHESGVTVTTQGTGKWTDYNLSFASKTKIDTIVVYAAVQSSWDIHDNAAGYRLLVNGEAVAIDSVTVDRETAGYAVATIKFAAKDATTALIAINNAKYCCAIYEIEAFNSADMPEEPSSEEASSEEASSEEASSEEASSEESSEGTSEGTSEPEVETATIYFDNASYNWAQVYAYVYSDSGEIVAWPGTLMEVDAATGLYKMALEGEYATAGKVVFTEAADASTNRYPAHGEEGVLVAGKDMIFGENASWVEYIPEVVEPEGPVEVNYAEGKKYTTAGPGDDGAPKYLAGGVDDGTLLTDGVLADGGKMGQVSFEGSSTVHTITIDLGAKRTDIDKLVFAGCRIDGNRQFAALRIEVSNNGSSYTAIGTADYVQTFNETDAPMNDVIVDFNNDVTARYVRVTCANTAYVFSVSEIQVIGYGAEGPVNPDDNENPGDAGFAVVALVAMISLAAAVVVSKRKFN